MKRAAPYLLIGYAIGALAVIIFDRIYEGGWRGGFAILWLSLPTTVVYFVILLGMLYWLSLSPGEVSLASCGCLAAAYPIFCGFFPIYYMRWDFAVAVGLLQLGLLLAITLTSSIRRKSKRATAL